MSRSVNEIQAALPAAGGKPCSIRLVLDFNDAPGSRDGRDRRALEGTAAELRAMVEGYAAAGVEEIVVDANRADLAGTLACYERFWNEVARSRQGMAGRG